MKKLEKEYPILKSNRIHQETKNKNKKYLTILIVVILGVIYRLYFYT